MDDSWYLTNTYTVICRKVCTTNLPKLYMRSGYEVPE